MASPELTAKIDALTDCLNADLKRLARIRMPSAWVPQPGYPRREVLRAHDLLIGLLRDVGVRHLRDLTLPDTNPVVTGEIPPPSPAAPTVLLYGRYDVRPPGADADAVNLIVPVGVIRAFDGRPPVGVKLVFEGWERPGSVFGGGAHPEPAELGCDVVRVARLGDRRGLRDAVLAEAEFFEALAVDRLCAA